MEKYINRVGYFDRGVVLSVQNYWSHFRGYTMTFVNFLSSRAVVQNIATVVVVYLAADGLGYNAGRITAERTLGPTSATVSQLTDMERANQAKIQAQIIRNRRNGTVLSTAAR